MEGAGAFLEYDIALRTCWKQDILVWQWNVCSVSCNSSGVCMCVYVCAYVCMCVGSLIIKPSRRTNFSNLLLE